MGELLDALFSGETNQFHTFIALAAAMPILAIVFSFFLQRKIRAADMGTPEMIKVWRAIRKGAMAFLKREYKSLSIFVLAVALILAFFLGGTIDGLGWKTSIAFVVGAVLSSLCGFLGIVSCIPL